MSEQEVTITGNDIEAAGRMLAEFGRQLPPNERVVIDWLLERAASAPTEPIQDADVQGYLFTGATGLTPALPGTLNFNQQFNRALGLSPYADGGGTTVVVSVGVRF